jgi:hypothetical protein
MSCILPAVIWIREEEGLGEEEVLGEATDDCDDKNEDGAGGIAEREYVEFNGYGGYSGS